MATLRFDSPHDDELTPDELSALLTSVMPEVPGYRVMRRIGKGGMSYVYLAVQESLDRQVAIKITAPDILRDEVSKQRFEQEARTIAKLEHPCIVGIHEVGRTPQGLIYFVMPYLAKGHLGQRDLSDDEPRVVEVLRALLSALAYAHQRGIVHRDVKAENVLFDNADRPVLADFGIALHSRGLGGRITGAGMALGSAATMAPEQARGDVVDLRADLYAVGVVAYELLTGRLPFDGKDALALAVMHANDPIPRLPSSKQRWQAWIDRAMAKDREQRFPSAEAMLAALPAEAPVAAHTPIPPTIDTLTLETVDEAAMPAGRLPPAPPKPWLLRIAVISALIALASVGGWLWERTQVTPSFITASPEPPPLPSTVVEAEDPIGALAAHVGATPTDAEPTTGVTEAAPASVNPAMADYTATLGFQSTALRYDPQQPGARELVAARDHIAEGRLGAPPGDNAGDALRAAHALAPADPGVRAVFEEWLDRVDAEVASQLATGRHNEATSLWSRMTALAGDLGLADSPRLAAMKSRMEADLTRRLGEAMRIRDAAAVARLRETARALRLETPAWQVALRDAERRLLPQPGEPAGAGFRVIVPPTATTDGFAAMDREVTLGDYTRFVQATGHASGRCTGGFLQRRRWDDPGYAQGDNHPVTCITLADAQAYANWRSREDGARYTLPDERQWAALGTGVPVDCREARLACDGRDGTWEASAGGVSTLGLRGVGGNAREWLRDGRVAGPGWRTPAVSATVGTVRAPADERGADDIGFRLVKVLPPPVPR